MTFVCLYYRKDLVTHLKKFSKRIEVLTRVKDMLLEYDLYELFSEAMQLKFMLLDENAEPYSPEIFLSNKIDIDLNDDSFCIMYYYKTPKEGNDSFVRGDYALCIKYKKGCKSISVTDIFPNCGKNRYVISEKLQKGKIIGFVVSNR